MEHQTGPDGPAETEEAEQTATVHGGVPESASAERDEERAARPESEVGADRATEPAAERAREPQPVPTTGEPRVDAALKLLNRLPDLAVSEHSEVYEQVHAQLADVLGELDSGPAGPAGG